jgi:hypothetical protein
LTIYSKNKFKCSNGLGFVDSYEQLINEVVFNKQTHERIEKVLVVNFSAEMLPGTFVSNDEILVVSTSSDVTSNSTRTNVRLNKLDSDTDYLTAFLRIVLPIAYQFNPDITYVYAGNGVTDEKANVVL